MSPKLLGYHSQFFGKDFSHMFMFISVQSSRKTSGEVGRKPTKGFGNDTKRVSSGEILEEFVNEDLGNDFFLPQMICNNPMPYG